jgi:hypothetical protein
MPPLTQAIGPRTSQVLPEKNSPLHITSVSKQFSSLILHRPLCSSDSLSYSSSPPSISAVDSAIELEHAEGATTVGLSNSATSKQYIDTGFSSESLSPKGDLKSDATPLLQDIISKTTLSPLSFDRTHQQILESSDTLHADYSSESYPVPTDYSTSLECAENGTSGETGKRKVSQKETTSDRLSSTEQSDTTGRTSGTTGHSIYKVPTHKSQTMLRTLAETATPQNSPPMVRPTSATKPSKHEWQNTAIYGSNISAWLSKQGMVLILSSALGGSIALIRIFVLHYLIIRHLCKRACRSTSVF